MLHIPLPLHRRWIMKLYWTSLETIHALYFFLNWVMMNPALKILPKNDAAIHIQVVIYLLASWIFIFAIFYVIETFYDAFFEK